MEKFLKAFCWQECHTTIFAAKVTPVTLATPVACTAKVSGVDGYSLIDFINFY